MEYKAIQNKRGFKAFIVRILGFRGSWRWACRMLDKGHIVYRTTDTGAAKYRLDNEGQRRIQVCYTRMLTGRDGWVNAYIFLDDFECTSWGVHR